MELSTQAVVLQVEQWFTCIEDKYRSVAIWKILGCKSGRKILRHESKIDLARHFSPWIKDRHLFCCEFVRESKIYMAPDHCHFMPWICTWIEDRLCPQSMPYFAVNLSVKRRQTWPQINAILTSILAEIYYDFVMCFSALLDRGMCMKLVVSHQTLAWTWHPNQIITYTISRLFRICIYGCEFVCQSKKDVAENSRYSFTRLK